MRPPSSVALVAWLALFVALSSTGVAQHVVTSAKRLVTGKDIARNAITSPKVKNNSLTGADVRNGSLSAGDLAPGTIPPAPEPFDGFTKAQSDGRYQPAGNYQPAGDYLATTGKAADADKLDGLDAGAFVPSQRIGGGGTVAEGNNLVLFTVPDALTVTGYCLAGDPPTARIRFDYLVAWDLLFYQQGASNPSFLRGIPGAQLDPSAPSQFTGTPGPNHRVDAKLATADFSRMVQLEVNGQPFGNFNCDFVGYAARLDHPNG